MSLSRRRRVEDEEIELDMVPIMNMFLVLIPFLLLSASFFHIKAINTSVPVLSSTEASMAPDSKISEVKVTVIVELKENTIVLTAMSDELQYEDLAKLEADIPVNNPEEYPMEELAAHLRYIKESYPKSDTLILVPAPSVVYGTIIQTMDMARSADNSEMFPNVVLSGKVG
ncbi:MAG: biopolymer transporter ExbD [Proteobacteria bacterium]|nr:biopolymer transporter ExbD [Pseudomonadota bacterium]